MSETLIVGGALIGTCAVYLFLQGLFPPRTKIPSVVRIGAYAIYAVFWAMLLLHPVHILLSLAYAAAGALLLGYCFYDVRVSQALFASIVMTAVYGTVDLLFWYLVPMLKDDLWGEIVEYPATRGQMLLLFHLVLLLVVLVVLVIARRHHTTITLPFILMLLPGYIISGVVCFSTYWENPSPLLLFAAMGLFYMDFLAVFYAEKIKREADRQKEVALAQQHYEMQEAYYAQLRSDQNETRAMFHDIQKYMLAMESLVQEHSSEEARELMDQTQQLHDCIGNVVDVGNPIVSMILNEYLHKAEEAGIKFSYQVSIPPILPIAAVDFYILLGNTLDNALEAAQAIQTTQEDEPPVVRVQLKQQNDILFYQVENPYPTNYFQRIRTKQHGYGLQNVQRCVKKYGGDTMTTSENGHFTFSAHLNLC